MQTNLLRSKFGVSKSGYICESAEIEGDDDGFYDDEDETVSEGYRTIIKAMGNPDSVQLYPCNDKYYVMSESIQNYMLYSGTTEIEEAIHDIADANNIEYESICCLGDFDDDFLPEDDDDTVVTEAELSDSAILYEAVEDGAMSLKQAERTYNKIIKKCKDKASTKKEINKCIDTLEKCVDRMEKEKEKVDNGLKSKERVKYSLSSLIPFNSLYRMFKYNDWNEPGIFSDITNTVGTVIDIMKGK